MNLKFVSFGIAAMLCFASQHLLAQNADEIIYNQYKQSYNYIGGSFVIDTGKSLVQNQKRAFLIWANNLKQDSLQRNFSLAEFGTSGNFLSQKGTAFDTSASQRTLFPKKIIKGRKEHVYYLLAYTINSRHWLGNFKVYSSPVIYKIDGNTLNPIWTSRISLAGITTDNAQTLIEYNDMIETKDGDIIVVGRYGKTSNQKNSALAARLSGGTGVLLWQYYYAFGNNCNEGINAVAETNDGNLSLVGYANRCSGNVYSGPNDMFYTQITPGGAAIAGTYKRYIWQGKLSLWADNITCYTSNAGSDQLVVSGYVDIPLGNSSNRQILVANLKQNGSAISWQHIGDTLQDVANDLIFQQVGQQDYTLFLTGQTSNYNSTSAVKNEAFFTSLKFSAGGGVSGVGEFSIFPVSLAPYNTYTGRIGVEIKNASKYRRFAILATGNYKPSKVGQTYTDILVRDFDDVNGGCIKRYFPPVRPFTPDLKTATATTIQLSCKVYKEDWIKMDKLTVKQLCQQVKIDPYAALANKVNNSSPVVSSSVPDLLATPNPVRNAFLLSTVNKQALTGNGETAVINIYNASMQLMQTQKVTQNATTISIMTGGFKPGLYHLQLVQKSGIRTVKFSKE